MKTIKLAVLPGDGIGQDVTQAAVPIFEALNVPVELSLGEIGWECWKREGDPIPKATWDLIRSADASLLGAITSKPQREAIKELSPHLKDLNLTYVSPVIQLRQQLDLYANIRPCYNIKNSGEAFNFCVIRENTEGLYAGFDYYPLPHEIEAMVTRNPRWSHLKAQNASCSLRLQTRAGLNRLFEFSFKFATQNKFKRVTLADKPNVLRSSSAFSREIFEEVAKKYPDIKADILNVDAVALWMVKSPHEFGVLVAENMFGDILSDLGGGIMGGLGFAPSANIGLKGCYFEPVHGSAPRIKPNCANPSAMFLTIALLLEHFNYLKEAQQVRSAVERVVKEARHVTYDLGGKTSTQEMAKAIIEACFVTENIQRVSFLATGDEIVQGDVQNTNTANFSKEITDHGGIVHQHLQVSDRKSDIVNGLKYLMNAADAVIVTGGLGPTSDDCTRFAIAEATHSELKLDERAWDHVQKRLKQFNLTITDSNRQQALFPPQAELIPNTNGTAFGCFLRWNNKTIFMLPGPPQECRPMFDQAVLPILENMNFFKQKRIYRWLTMGLIEGEIAPEVDKLALNYSVETAFRWNYPFLEIKIKANEKQDLTNLLKALHELLKNHLVTTDNRSIFEIVKTTLHSFPGTITIAGDLSSSTLPLQVNDPKLHFVAAGTATNCQGFVFSVEMFPLLKGQNEHTGVINFKCQGTRNGQVIYTHELTTPNRNAEIAKFAENYMAWQLNYFLKTIERLYGFDANLSTA